MPWWHIEIERCHVLYDRETFLADMKMAVSFPRLCHSVPAGGRESSRSRWLYYTCASDALWFDSAMRVVVERRPADTYEVIVTAFLDPAVDLTVFAEGVEIEVGVRPERDNPYLCRPRRLGEQRRKRRR